MPGNGHDRVARYGGARTEAQFRAHVGDDMNYVVQKLGELASEVETDRRKSSVRYTAVLTSIIFILVGIAADLLTRL